jgi:hypothetical protein
MRFLAGLAALLIGLSVTPAVAANDADTLKGNVTKDSQTRVVRPHVDALPGGVDTTVATPAPKLHARLDVGAFDLNSQRARVPAGVNFGNLNGWIQSAPPGSDGADIRADMDRFFATGSARNGFVRPRLARAGRGVIAVRMGLCGSWDAQGDGHRRWAILNQELHCGGALQMLWQDWQQQVSSMLETEFQGLASMSGSAALHVAVRRDGYIESISEYHGPEQPFNHGHSVEMNAELSNTMARLGSLPAFPPGSQAPEAHVLVFVAN